MFIIGNEYTRDEIHKHLGGSKQWYLPTLSGRVVAACLKPEMNRPNVILCGKGKIIASAGAALASQPDPIPVFIKLAINRWEYKGEYKVTASYSSGSQFAALISGSKRSPSDVSRVIELAYTEVYDSGPTECTLVKT